MLNNRLRDQLLLEACLRGEKEALDRWLIDSYEREVGETVAELLHRHTPGRVDRDFLEEVIVDCTSAIYEQYEVIPSRFFQLKTIARRYAFSYTMRYLATPGRKLSRGP